MSKALSKYLQLRFATAVIALLLSSQTLALTVYDVIQLSTKKYSDKDIITLIEVTNSAFELKANDIPRLLELGVSETVIQTMLKAVPEQATGHSKPSTAPQASSHIIVSETKNHSAAKQTKTPIAGGHFDRKSYQESGSGHHHHQAINMAGVKLLVLRHKGGFSSIKHRADAAVTQLGLAAAAGKGRFQPDNLNGTHVILFYSQNTDQPIYILSLSTDDAYAYQRRSGRTVTPTLLAAYWSSLLSDYWSIAVNNTKPIHLADVHEGEALQDLYQQWIKSPIISDARLQDAILLLSNQTQQHLQQLATTVPREFVINDEYTQVESQ